MNDIEYSYLKHKIMKLTDIDLDAYKSRQMHRRLEGYVNKSSATDIAGYCRMLDQNPEMVIELMDYLAINVSEFFRDLPSFEYLKKTVLPELLSRNRRLNIWSTACSCGQEAYSIAIMLEDICPQHRHRILATDIDRKALEQAGNGGPYSPSDVRNIDRHTLARFFVKEEDGYRVNDFIRKKVEIGHHNLLRGPFEYGFDLIVCRNVIIYFSNSVRDKLYANFYRSLRAGGMLFVGGSEVILHPDDLGFTMKHPSFYSKSHLHPEPATIEGAALPDMMSREVQI